LGQLEGLLGDDLVALDPAPALQRPALGASPALNSLTHIQALVTPSGSR
jgi:hypothetical protein